MTRTPCCPHTRLSAISLSRRAARSSANPASPGSAVSHGAPDGDSASAAPADSARPPATTWRRSRWTAMRNLQRRRRAIGRPADGPRPSERLDDLFGHLLRVAEEHHRVVAEEQLVLDPGIAGAHAALDEQHGLGL